MNKRVQRDRHQHLLHSGARKSFETRNKGKQGEKGEWLEEDRKNPEMGAGRKRKRRRDGGAGRRCKMLSVRRVEY